MTKPFEHFEVKKETKQTKVDTKRCLVCGKDIMSPGEIHIAGSVCRGHSVQELLDWKSDALSTQRQQLIKAIIKNLKFYNWKGNIKTVELKEYLKSL